MRVVGLGLTLLGAFLIYTWFGTRRTMLREGTWKRDGGVGAYIWLMIHAAIVFLGLKLVG